MYCFFYALRFLFIGNVFRLRPLSYPGTGIFTLCFSVVDRRSFKSINELWVPELRHHCPNAPILLVGTKIDLRSESDESKTYPDVELPITYVK